MRLRALREYRSWSYRLNDPAFDPTAERFFPAVSRNARCPLEEHDVRTTVVRPCRLRSPVTSPKPRSAAGQDTRQRILEAALATLTSEGIAGTSARAIASRGNFNQSLIFYHFGSVPDLLVAATRMLSEARLSRYRDRVAQVESLAELAAVAGELHEQDISNGQVTVLAQMLAGASSFPAIQSDLMDVFQPWIDLVDGVVQRLLPDSPLAALIRTDDVAFTVAALFVGLELLTGLGDDRERENRLFAMFEAAAALAQGMLHLADQQPSAGD